MNIVFDFGAVLFTWQPVTLVHQYFPERTPTSSEAGQLAHQIFGHPDWHAFDRGSATMAQTIARTVERLGLDSTALSQLVEGIGDHLAPLPESVALLQELQAMRGQANAMSGTPLRVYFLSNMPVPYARTLEHRHAFLKDFDGGIFSGDVLRIKPEPAIYQMLQSRYALEPAQTVFIDDLKGNVTAAQALGWHGIQFESAQQLRTELTRRHLDKKLL